MLTYLLDPLSNPAQPHINAHYFVQSWHCLPGDVPTPLCGATKIQKLFQIEWRVKSGELRVKS